MADILVVALAFLPFLPIGIGAGFARRGRERIAMVLFGLGLVLWPVGGAIYMLAPGVLQGFAAGMNQAIPGWMVLIGMIISVIAVPYWVLG